MKFIFLSFILLFATLSVAQDKTDYYIITYNFNLKRGSSAVTYTNKSCFITQNFSQNYNKKSYTINIDTITQTYNVLTIKKRSIGRFNDVIYIVVRDSDKHLYTITHRNILYKNYIIVQPERFNSKFESNGMVLVISTLDICGKY